MTNPDETDARGYEIPVGDTETGKALPQALANHTGMSIAQVKDAMHKGAVWLRRGQHVRRTRRQDTRLQAGDTVYLHHNPNVLGETPLQPTLISDQQQFSVWNKPAGMRSEGSRWGDHTSIGRVVEVSLQRPVFLVHRLDRAASGLMLLAHSKAMSRKLSALFAAREMEKTYQVRVHGKFPSKPSPFRLKEALDGKAALSLAERLAFDPETKTSLLRVDIETGRKHQIRRHLSQAGFPVIGDRLYGKEGDKDDLALTAVRLAFAHPDTGERVSFELET